jgi:hypothetical protein
MIAAQPFRPGPAPADCQHAIVKLTDSRTPSGARRIVCQICGHVVGFGGGA